MSRKRLLIVLSSIVAAVVVAVLVVVFLILPDSEPAPKPVAVTVPVVLSGKKLPNDAKIGVVVTLGSGNTEGSEWNRAAEGARVAQERFAMGGSAFTLITQDDGGTSTGGKEAVESLVAEKVSGIVIATSGKHLSGALSAAEAAGVPVVLPYAQVPSDATKAWTLADPDAKVEDALKTVLAEYKHPLHLDAGSGLPEGVTVNDRVAFAVGTDFTVFASDIARRTGTDALAGGAYGGGEKEGEPKIEPVKDPADAIVITGSPRLQGSIVAALQQRGVNTPIIMPEALGSAFSSTLLERGGTVTPQLRSVGGFVGDSTALNADEQGRAMSAFLAATRQFAADEGVKDLAGDAPFSEVAADADARSHDAVIALVDAISRANSTEVAKVEASVRSMKLGASDGIAGPKLNFSSQQASTGGVSALRMTDQDLGLRYQAEGAPKTMAWFVEPAAQSK